MKAVTAMNRQENHIDSNKFTVLFIWLATTILLIGSYSYLRDIIAFILSKLYEYFIQQKMFQP